MAEFHVCHPFNYQWICNKFHTSTGRKVLCRDHPTYGLWGYSKLDVYLPGSIPINTDSTTLINHANSNRPRQKSEWCSWYSTIKDPSRICEHFEQEIGRLYPTCCYRSSLHSIWSYDLLSTPTCSHVIQPQSSESDHHLHPCGPSLWTDSIGIQHPIICREHPHKCLPLLWDQLDQENGEKE